jgi:hypothetical protein
VYRSINILRFFLISGALILGWLSFAHATALVVRDSNPKMALSLVPNDPIAMTKAIDPGTLFSASSMRIARTKESVKAALRSQAVSSSTVRMLALVNYADGKISAANAALGLSEKLSRREVSVQIGLIQNSVLRDNAAQALYHYDTALRTSPGSQENLFPFMVAATGERELISDFAKILARGPEWRFPFYAALIEKTPSRENVALLYLALVGTAGAFHEEATADLINRLANDKNYPLAYSIYSQAVPDAAKDPFAFKRSSRFQPFDWLVFDTPDAGAFLASNGGKQRDSISLFFRAEASEDQPIARKFVTLPSGRYQLNVQGTMQAFVYWSIKCADGLVLTGGDNTQGSKVDFLVPAVSCGAQIIDLNVLSKAQPVSGQIDKVTLLRR